MSGSTGFKEDMLKEFLKGLNAGMKMFDKNGENSLAWILFAA